MILLKNINKEVEYFDDDLKAEDLDESKLEEDSHLKSIKDYYSSSRRKPNAMLSHYKAFTSQKFTDNVKQFDIKDFMQISNLNQETNYNKPKYSSIQIKTKRENRNKDNNLLAMMNASNPMRSDSPILQENK